MLEGYDKKSIDGILTKKVKVKAPLRGFAKDIVLKVETDADGIPLERYWRDRFKDAEVDGCIEIIEDKPRSKK